MLTDKVKGLTCHVCKERGAMYECVQCDRPVCCVCCDETNEDYGEVSCDICLKENVLPLDTRVL